MQSCFSEYSSPLGKLTLVANGRGLAGVYFEHHAHFQGTAQMQRNDHHPVFDLVEQLTAYFAGQRKSFSVPLDLSAGTAFQQQVWRLLAEIPYGETVSYGALAEKLENPRAVRAVGAANGRNPFSILLPCHRVIASDGRLTGYAGGLKNKAFLLKFEASNQQLIAE
jgi:methylated-DNA-[protein]-cysteine S-methyltransferase